MPRRSYGPVHVRSGYTVSGLTNRQHCSEFIWVSTEMDDGLYTALVFNQPPWPTQPGHTSWVGTVSAGDDPAIC